MNHLNSEHLTFDMKKHLESRGAFDSVADYWEADGEVVFKLYTVTQSHLVGVQYYNPHGLKKLHKDFGSKYMTKAVSGYLGCVFPKNFNEAVSTHGKVVFVQEGVFSMFPLAQLGFPAVAILSNSNSAIVRNFRLAGYRVFTLADGDKAGLLLARKCDKMLQLEEGLDVGDYWDQGRTEELKSMALELLEK